MSTVNRSLFWYDFETTGINPRCDRPLQVAGIRTDESLNEIGEPLNLYCQLSADILPHPQACLVTGIGPQILREQGMPEAAFMTRLHAEMSVSGTCTAGYNSLRFDDEVTRYSLYRNFFDPYAREWQGGNSRWDLIDALRCAYALRPEGIEWPQVEGRVSLRLELLSAANGLAHEQAHDALSDVRATIAMARLLRERQPRLYDYLYRLRSKQEVQRQLRLLEPVLHVSGRFSADRHFISVVLPLAWHATNRNALVVCDLQADPAPLLELDGEQLRQRLYTRREELAEGELPVPLKLLHINRCPVVAPMNVLREGDAERLQLDLGLCRQRRDLLCEHQPVWQDKLAAVFAAGEFAPCDDPEQQLYDGFISERDRRLCDRVRQVSPAQLASEVWPFGDERLPELLFRYRARNYPETLSEGECAEWLDFCRKRLANPGLGAPLLLNDFLQSVESLRAVCTPAQWQLLECWREYALSLAQ